MPNTATASTGLSSQLAPGDISRLVQSDDRVFRVSFTGQTPDYHQLYWRALVLDSFDGERWLNRYSTRLQQLGLSSHFQPETAGQPIDYTIIQDPSARHWLFSLASVDINQIKSTLTIDSLPDYTLRSQTPINQLQRYQLRSYLASQRELTLTTTQRVQQTQLQHRRVVNQKLHAWAREMAEQYPDPEQFIAQVLNTIRQQAFRYTLTPPVLVQHNLDQFFFQTKAGFCEHYASAFAYIMRAANIPARVVLGYMGGEYNAQGGYYTIRQYDAHAWVEVWLSGKGWQRVDPTAAISPERIEHGFSERLFEQTSTRTWTQWIALNQQPWFSQAKALFAAIDFKWTTWVVSFNSEKQFTLLQQWLGEISATKIASLLFSTALFSVLLMMLWSFPRIKFAQSTQLKQEFQSLLKYVQALQTTKINTAKLTPLQLQTIVVDPAVKAPWQVLCTLYQQYYYQPNDVSEQRSLMQRFYQLARPFKWRLRWLRLKHSCGRLMLRFSR
jgi:transglutaminase-like putative cysteine protease